MANRSRLPYIGCEVQDFKDNPLGSKSAPTLSWTDPREEPPPGTDYPRVRDAQMTGTAASVRREDKGGKDPGSDSAHELRLTCTGCVMSCSDKIAKWNALGIIL